MEALVRHEPNHAIDVPHSEAAAYTHRGYRKAVNQDAYALSGEKFAVFDGVGGTKLSHIASRMVAEIFEQRSDDINDYRAFILWANKVMLRMQSVRDEQDFEELCRANDLTFSGELIECILEVIEEYWILFNKAQSVLYPFDKIATVALFVEHTVLDAREKIQQLKITWVGDCQAVVLLGNTLLESTHTRYDRMLHDVFGTRELSREQKLTALRGEQRRFLDAYIGRLELEQENIYSLILTLCPTVGQRESATALRVVAGSDGIFDNIIDEDIAQLAAKGNPRQACERTLQHADKLLAARVLEILHRLEVGLEERIPVSRKTGTSEAPVPQLDEKVLRDLLCFVRGNKYLRFWKEKILKPFFIEHDGEVSDKVRRRFLLLVSHLNAQAAHELIDYVRRHEKVFGYFIGQWPHFWSHFKTDNRALVVRDFQAP